jgi:hypothetical protein
VSSVWKAWYKFPQFVEEPSKVITNWKSIPRFKKLIGIEELEVHDMVSEVGTLGGVVYVSDLVDSVFIPYHL